MTYVNEEHGNWLIDNGVLLCTSLDGPEAVHDYNRPWTGGGAAYATIVKWMKWFNALSSWVTIPTCGMSMH